MSIDISNDKLIPKIAVVSSVREDTPDVKTFRVVPKEGETLFEHMPGQCAMLSLPGVGEAMFSITSSPTEKGYKDFSIKRCGTLTINKYLSVSLIIFSFLLTDSSLDLSKESSIIFFSFNKFFL